MKKSTAILLSVLLIAGVALSTGASITVVEEQGFPTPEEAIEHFIGGIAANDLESALSACAIEAYGDSFDYEAKAERLRAITPYMGEAPAEYPLYADMNKLTRASALANQAKLFCFSLLTPLELDAPTQLEEGGTMLKEFVEAVDPSRLQSLKIVSIDQPYSSISDTDRLKETFALQASLAGADGKTERIVLYDLDGQLYCGGFQLLNFEDGWKIDALNSILAGQNAMGMAFPITEDEYLSMQD